MAGRKALNVRLSTVVLEVMYVFRACVREH